MTAAVEAALYRVVRLNPCVAVHELRMRMRGWRPFGVLAAYSGVACAAVLIALIPITLGQRYFGRELFQVGRGAFSVLVHTQLTLVMLILPAYAAGAIALEREKRTLEMLRVSLVTPFDIVTGKFLVVLAFGAVLLVSSLPVAAWCMMLGGLAPEEVFYSYSYLLAVALFVTGLGMLFSSFMARSTGAVVATYGVLIGLGVLSVVIPMVLMIPAYAAGGPAALGPVAALAGTLVLGLITGWLGFLLFRMLLTRPLGRQRRGLASLLALLPVLGWMWYLVNPSGPVFQAIENSQVPWLMVLNPYAALSTVMGGAFAQMMAYGPGPAGGALTALVVWAVITSIYLLAGAALWAGAIRIFAGSRT